MCKDRKADAEIQQRLSAGKATMDLDYSSDEKHEEPDLPASPVQQLGNTSKPLFRVIYAHLLTGCL